MSKNVLSVITGIGLFFVFFVLCLLFKGDHPKPLRLTSDQLFDSSRSVQKVHLMFKNKRTDTLALASFSGDSDFLFFKKDGLFEKITLPNPPHKIEEVRRIEETENVIFITVKTKEGHKKSYSVNLVSGERKDFGEYTMAQKN